MSTSNKYRKHTSSGHHFKHPAKPRSKNDHKSSSSTFSTSSSASSSASSSSKSKYKSHKHSTSSSSSSTSSSLSKPYHHRINLNKSPVSPFKSRAARRREKQFGRCEWERCSKKEEQQFWRLDPIEFNFEMQRMSNQKYCERCKKVGDHSTPLCNVFSADDYCFVCGGQHMGQLCAGNCCSVCSLNHHRSNCQVSIKQLFCTICNQVGHLDILCSNNWRMFSAIDQSEVDLASSSILNCPPSQKSTKKSCPNCGSNKHFYNDCPQLAISTFKHRNPPLTVNLDDRNLMFEQNLDLIQTLQPQFNYHKRRGSIGASASTILNKKSRQN